MNDLKKLFCPLHQRMLSKSVIGCLLIGFLMSGPLSAQHSASQTIIIRIIRPIQYSIEPVENNFQSDLQQQKGQVNLNWKSDSRLKKITVSRKSDNPESKLDLVMPNENHSKSRNRLRVEALEKNLAGAISGTAGSLTMRYESGSNSSGGPKSAKQQIYYTVMDI